MRIVHAADFHLDSPFDGLSPRQAVQRRAEQRQLLERLAELTRTTRAQLLLLSGDLLDGERVYQETVEELCRVLGGLDIPVFISPGNHDFYSHRSPYALNRWPDNVHIFTGSDVEAVDLPHLNAVVYGAAFTSDRQEGGLLQNFTVPGDGRIHLMVLHADVDARQDSHYCPISTGEIAATGLDYLALGHIHACSGVRMAGQVPWAYPGCPEGRGFDETGVKGVLCGEVEHGRADLRFVPLCRRQYQVVELPVTPEDDADSIVTRALAHSSPNDPVRFILTGETQCELDTAALAARCAGSFYSVTFRDRTRLYRGLWERAGEENLTGLFLRQMQEKLKAAADEQEADLIQKATRFGLAALEHREDCAP